MKFKLASETKNENENTWKEVKIIEIHDEKNFIVSFNDNNSPHFITKSIRFIKSTRPSEYRPLEKIEFKVNSGWKEGEVIDRKGRFYYIKDDDERNLLIRQVEMRKVEVIEKVNFDYYFQVKSSDISHIKDLITSSRLIFSSSLLEIKENHIRIFYVSCFSKEYSSDDEIILDIKRFKGVLELIFQTEKGEDI